MFLKTPLTWNVIIPAEKLEINGLELQKAIMIQLLDDFAAKKATKDLGYFLAVTSLNKIGEGKVRDTGDVLFRVDFTCLTFKIFKGEILQGTVYKIFKHGILLRCGPCDKVYLSHQKMSDYEYVPGENPFFKSNASTIEKGAVLRLKVIGDKYVEAEGEIQAVVGMDGDFLGHI